MFCTPLAPVHKTPPMAMLASQAGRTKPDVHNSCYHKPTLYCTTQLKPKFRYTPTGKAWRDWTGILITLCNLSVMDKGYQLPKGIHAQNSCLVRIAMDEDDLDFLHGVTPHYSIYRMLRKLWIYNWLTVICVIPWLIYNLSVRSVASIMYQLIWMRNTAPLLEHHYAFWWLLVILIAGSICNRFLQWKQSYVVLRVSTQAYNSAQRDIWNAEQEKTSVDAIASMPVQTKAHNEGLDAAKNMPGIMKIQYTTVLKLLTAALAMKVAVLHECLEDNQTAEDPKPEIIVDPAETEEVDPTRYKLLGYRTSTAEPNTLRPSIEIKEKSEDQLFEDRQKGLKVKLPGDGENKNFSAVQVAPGLLKIIPSLGSSKENEVSGVHRHLRVLQHPTKGGDLPTPTPQAEALLDKAVEIIGAHFAKRAEKNASNLHHWKCPEKWTQNMKDEIPEKAIQAMQSGPDPEDLGTNPQGWLAPYRARLVKGFVKAGELMLPLAKHSRLIGDLGPVANLEDAMSIGPLENLMKECYPHLITKKLTLAETDEKIAKLLLNMRKHGLRPESDDYSAMDSSWTLKDRARLRRMANMALTPIRKFLQTKERKASALRNYDHVLDAHNTIVKSNGERRKVRWQLKYITCLMTPGDCPLFSGERMTSLMNRWLVLVLECAEDLRCMGEELGTRAIHDTLEGKRLTTIGDGDDNLQGIYPGRYANTKERIERFADYYKLLDVCSAPDEQTDAEVLSRFHIWTQDLKRYVHIGKLERNMGRLIAFKIPRTDVDEDTDTTTLTNTEIQMICTDIWQRIMSLASTMVVRHFARAVFVYMLSKLTNPEAGTVYDEDGKRLGREDGDKALTECLAQINEAIDNAPTSTWAMVKVSYFKNIKDLSSKQIKQLKKEWAAADAAMMEAEIGEKHILYPTTFVEDFPISSNVSRALGLSKECIAVALEREARAQPQDAANAPLGSSGKLADVSDPSSTGRAEDTCADPASEPVMFDISSDDESGPDTTGAGVPSGVTAPRVIRSQTTQNVQGWLCSGINYARSIVTRRDNRSDENDIELGTALLSQAAEYHIPDATDAALEPRPQSQIPIPAGWHDGPESFSGWEIGSQHDVVLSRQPSTATRTGSATVEQPDVGGILDFLNESDEELPELRAHMARGHAPFGTCDGCRRVIKLTDSYIIPMTQPVDLGDGLEEVTVDYKYCLDCHTAIQVGTQEPFAVCMSCEEVTGAQASLLSILDKFGGPGNEKYCHMCDTTSTRNRNFILPPAPTRCLIKQPMELDENLYRHIKSFVPKCRIKEVGGNLFHASEEFSLCHCVSRDFHMQNGIAHKWATTFPYSRNALVSQNATVGGVAALPRSDIATLYYLVTKEWFGTKPTLITLKQSLEAMREAMRARGETKLAMPRIGCGLDKLTWRDVKNTLFDVFKHSDVLIVVYTHTLKPIHSPEEKRKNSTNAPAAYPAVSTNPRVDRTDQAQEIQSHPAPPGLCTVGKVPSVTSRKSDNEEEGRDGSQAVVRRVEQGLARTKCSGQQKNVVERQGNGSAPQKVRVEPLVFPRTPTTPSVPLVKEGTRQQVVGGSQHSKSAIDSTGSETHGAKQADKRDQPAGSAQARPSGSLPEIDEDGFRRVTRRGKKKPAVGTAHLTPVTAAASSKQQKTAGAAAPPKRSHGSASVWRVKPHTQ